MGFCRVARVLLSILILSGLFLLWRRVKPWRVWVDVRPHPAASYAEALARIAAVQEQEQERGDINPVCLTQVLAHGQHTAKAIVLFHGFTSCPAQFTALGQLFFEQGYNVYIPRTPYHGLDDLLSAALRGLTAEVLATFGMETVDMVRGLGEEVTLCGLSMGGALVAWLAQTRGDVDVAVLIAPFLGIGFVPAWMSRPLTRVTLATADRWQWWDPVRKENNPETAAYGYRRYPTHAMAEVLRLGFAAQQEARRKKPKTPQIVVVTNANDKAVHNGIAAALVNAWRKRGTAVTSYEFAKSLNLPHDLIAPERPSSDVGVVYPVLLELISVDGNR